MISVTYWNCKCNVCGSKWVECPVEAQLVECPKCKRDGCAVIWKHYSGMFPEGLMYVFGEVKI